MTVGAAQDKASIDGRAYSLSITLRNVLTDVDHFKAFLDRFTDADLQAKGYSSDEVILLKSAITQLKAGADVLRGQGTQAQANDFLFFSNQLIGPN